MTYRSTDSSCKSCYSQPQSRLNQQIKSVLRDEGCPVLEESGTVCGETDSLKVFLQFKKTYEDSLRKLERTPEGIATLRRLAPFQRLIDHLWEQNAMLIEIVGELEDEATCRLSNLQEKLNKSCQKIDEYQEDINSLLTIIHRFCRKGTFDPEGVKFKTIPPACVYGCCDNSNNECEDLDEIEKLCSMSDSSFDCSDFGISADDYGFQKSLNKWKNQVEEKYADFSKFNSLHSQNQQLEQSKSDYPQSLYKNKCRCTQTRGTKSVNWEIIKCPKCEEFNKYFSCDCMFPFM